MKVLQSPDLLRLGWNTPLPPDAPWWDKLDREDWQPYCGLTVVPLGPAEPVASFHAINFGIQVPVESHRKYGVRLIGGPGLFPHFDDEASAWDLVRRIEGWDYPMPGYARTAHRFIDAVLTWHLPEPPQRVVTLLRNVTLCPVCKVQPLHGRQKTCSIRCRVSLSRSRKRRLHEG